MINPKISVIIPVYNVEKYLAECLDSCVNQTLRDIEIICVDDCSPDGSITILKKYAKKDSRIKIIRHETNMGLGAARNTGIANALGEYIWFVDSDDFIDMRACQILYDTACKNDADVLTFCAVNVISDDKENYVLENSAYYTDWPHNTVIDPAECQALAGKHFPVSACHYITRRNVMTSRKFRTSCYYEDTDFTPILFYESQKIFCICYTAYFRRINPLSITQTDFTPKKLQDLISVDFSLADYVKNHSVPRKTFLHTFYVSHVNYVFGLLQENEKMEIPPQMKKDFLSLKHENDAFDKKITVRIRRKLVRILEKVIRLVENME